MAEKKEKDGMVSIYNRGARTFIVSVGSGKPKIKIEPEKSALVPEALAVDLLKYKELIETGKMSARDGRTVTQLKAENDKLQAEIEKLKAAAPEAKPPKEGK